MSNLNKAGYSKPKGLELILLKDGEFVARTHLTTLKRVISEYMDDVNIKTERIGLTSSIWEDGKERKGFYTAMKVTAYNKVNEIENIFVGHTLH